MSSRVRGTALAAALLAAGATTLPFVPATAEPADSGTVTVRGYVFQFSKAMFRGVLPGAVVDAEINGRAPDASVVTPVVADADGYYEIEVPDGADVSLFATVPESARPLYDLDGTGPLPSLPVPFHTTYNQTFHTDGHDLDFVTFQVPAEPVVKELAGAFGLSVAGDLWPYESYDGGTGALDFNDGYGALTDGGRDVCVVASTVYRADKRIIIDRSGDRHAPTNAEYFATFYSNPPHGRDGATSDPMGDAYPIYFNSSVTPDPTERVTSDDGGVLWVDVPTGTHTVTAHKAGTRFASADITCKPGRFVNASPTWGLYELLPGEQTHPSTVTGVAITAPSVSTYGSSANVSVTVGGGKAADGLVALEVDGVHRATGRVVDGRANVSLPTLLAAGRHQVVAHYAPTGTIPARSSAAASFQTAKAVSNSSLAVSARTVKKGKKVKVTATVSAKGFVPAGTVQFYSGSTKIGSPVAVKGGKASVKVKVSTRKRFRAVYAGNANTQGSSTATVTVKVAKKVKKAAKKN